MDNRWLPPTQNSVNDYSVLLHQTAQISDVRTGVATDGVDLSPFMSAGTQSPMEVVVTIDFNDEFYGANQPVPGNLIEVQSDGQCLWVGIVDTLTSYAVSYGQRRMTITARSREGFDLWKLVKRVTSLYPTMTNLTSILQDVLAATGLQVDEILVDPSSYYTAHSNTQFSNETTWDIVNQVMLPMGLTPFIDWGGRLKGASRELQSIATSINLDQP